jgi:hypothetical protein
MQDSQLFLYQFPLFSRQSLLAEVVEELPDWVPSQLHSHWTDTLCVRIQEPTAAVYARMRYSEDPFATRDGTSLLEEGEIFVQSAEARDCADMLAYESSSASEWYRLLLVRASAAAQHEFAMAHAQIMSGRQAAGLHSPGPRARAQSRAG